MIVIVARKEQGSCKSLGLILCGPWLYVANFCENPNISFGDSLSLSVINFVLLILPNGSAFKGNIIQSF